MLQLLAEEPRNGYQVITALDERTDGAWRPSPGAIYPALSQLEDEGLIEAVDRDGGKAYQLTAAGREAPEVAEAAQRTWDQIKQASAPRHPGGDHAVWHEFHQLAQALKAVSISGNEHQHEAAAALLAETRRRVYGLLAEPPAEA
ncbi:MAG: PadR family transcriptional regulator [Actinomycetia bacterium]|nr:PadR family transcriptional regulator [Actinomycetes bacterium]